VCFLLLLLSSFFLLLMDTVPYAPLRLTPLHFGYGSCSALTHIHFFLFFFLIFFPNARTDLMIFALLLSPLLFASFHPVFPIFFRLFLKLTTAGYTLPESFLFPPAFSKMSAAASLIVDAPSRYSSFLSTHIPLKHAIFEHYLYTSVNVTIYLLINYIPVC
jgi:hypothetical protein